MKNLFKIFLVIIVCLVVNGCSDDNNKNNKVETSVIGTWKLVEAYGLDGVGGYWTSVENGYTYTFKADGTFTTNRFLEECTYGTYSFSETDEILSLVFGCEGFTTHIESPQGTFIENYVFSGQYLILTPTYLNCVEGCDYKFRRI